MSDLTAIGRIQQKLLALRDLDAECKLFGSDFHGYVMNPPISENKIKQFEALYKIILPSGYREFIKKIGNGGAGPYYGLERLEHTVFADLDYRDENDLLDPSEPFPLTQAWNQVMTKDEEEYFDNKWVTGLLRICNFGCGVSLNLVVNGEEYGNIWVDDRCSDGGIYPDPYFGRQERTTFLQWYELWLDRCDCEIQKMVDDK